MKNFVKLSIGDFKKINFPSGEEVFTKLIISIRNDELRNVYTIYQGIRNEDYYVTIKKYNKGFIPISIKNYPVKLCTLLVYTIFNKLMDNYEDHEYNKNILSLIKYLLDTDSSNRDFKEKVLEIIQYLDDKQLSHFLKDKDDYKTLFFNALRNGYPIRVSRIATTYINDELESKYLESIGDIYEQKKISYLEFNSNTFQGYYYTLFKNTMSYEEYFQMLKENNVKEY